MSEGRPITGRKVLIGLISFFGLVFAVNGVFTYLAIETWPGLSTQRAYQEGLDYNRTLEAAAAQDALQWRSEVSLAMARPGQPADVSVSIKGPSDAPVGDLDVALRMARPLGEAMATTVNLAERRDGIYWGAVTLPAAGRWYVDVVVTARGAETYRMRHEIWVDE